jgi:HlyD family secretion protein
MAASESIFRKVALERLSSPDQLDRLITLTSPIGWTSLVAIVVLICAAVIWSVVGRIPTRVEGAGILVTHGGQVFDAMAPAAGTLMWVAPIGSEVAKGDVVARFDDTQVRQDLEHARAVLNEQTQDLEQLSQRIEADGAARERVDAQRRANLQAVITAAEQRHSFYSDEMQRQAPVVQQGFITRRFAQETQQRVDTAEQDGRQARNDLLRIDADELDAKGRDEQELHHQQEAVTAAHSKVEELQTQLDRATKVASPIDGQVTEIKADVGALITAGKPILSIETAGKRLELVLYIPPDQGKHVVPDMPVRIEPAMFKKEEYGTLKGRVLSISQFPVSAEGMTAVLQNPQLVARFSAHGAPYAARVALAPDPATPSGYVWSAGQGPPGELSSGTTASAEITVREQAPITLVLPLLRGLPGIGR